MDNHSTNITDKEIQMLNVRLVISALNSLKTHATENELLRCCQTSNDEPDDVVRQEIRRILDLGVINGFIVRDADKKYALTSLETEYQIDGDSDDDLEYVSPKHPRYIVHSSPTARSRGELYSSIPRHTPPRSTPPRSTPPRAKRKYTKRKAEPTERVTRSSSRAKASASRTSSTSRASPAKKRKVVTKKEPKAPTKFSSRTITKGKGGRGRGR